MFCYPDGNLIVPTYLSNGNPAPVSAERFIGVRKWPYPNLQGPFDGLIDEVELFDRVLSGSEIAAIFNAGSAGKCKGEDPQTKDDCKNGGWEQSGFKNQGQCVRFIETSDDRR